jgi:Ca2+-binding RTX toxin-like protein
MVTMIRSDLDFILAQIKIAEADARGEPLLGTWIPNTELPWGLRRVDGSNNNLFPGQENYGAADQPFPSAVPPEFTTGSGGLAFGPPIFSSPGVPLYIPGVNGDATGVPLGYIPGSNYLNSNDYGARDPNANADPRAIQPGDVADAEPRIISNLIVDQTLNNPAVLFKSLQVAGVDDPFVTMQAIVALVDDLKDARTAVVSAEAALVAAQAGNATNQPTITAYTNAVAASATLSGLAAEVQARITALVTEFGPTTSSADAADIAALADAIAAVNALIAQAQAAVDILSAPGINAAPSDLSALQGLINTANATNNLLSFIDLGEATPTVDLTDIGFAGGADALDNALATQASAASAGLSTSLAGLTASVAEAEANLSQAEADATAAEEALAEAIEDNGLLTEPSPTGDILKTTLVVESVAPDAGLSSPFNGWMTFFGQFFDHGLDLVAKGGYGTVYIPLQPDDPLYVPGSSTNFMAVTRATLDENGNAVNKVTPFVDQNQTYTSNASHQFFLREYEMRFDPDYGHEVPVATGRLLNGSEDSGGGLATWADVKKQALEVLGIELDDYDVLNVPEVAVDPYGNFIRGANGFPQLVTSFGPPLATLSGTPASPVDASLALKTGHAFLDDIAHNAAPGEFDANPSPSVLDMQRKVADADSDVSTANQSQPTGTYDNELLDAHYITGDGRGNENIGLTAVHHVFHSEHNRQIDLIKTLVIDEAKAAADASGLNPTDTRLAAAATEKLAFLNEWLDPDYQLTAGQLAAATVASVEWNGERLFQAAKVPTEMQYQHLVFEEFARTVQPFVNVFNDYNGQLDSAILAEFAHTVYRFGHSMLTETVDRLDENNEVVGSGGVTGSDQEQIGLIEAFLNPIEFANGGVDAEAAAGAIARGMTRVVGNEIDEFVTEALRNNLVGLPLDLAAINIARGRETGVPKLNAARAEFYEGSGDSQVRPYVSWADFAANLKNPASIVNFIAAYGTHQTIVDATTVEAKRDAAWALVFGGPGVTDVDRLDFLHARGTYAGDALLGGLNNVDFWIGGLAEKQMAFGGMLGTTFNFVFEVQLENLQNGDRFYYLSRLANLNLTAQLENNKFAEMIARNTNASHLPGNVFKAMDYQLEVDQSKQFNHGLGSDDPEGVSNGLDPFLGAINGDRKVIRDTVDGYNLLQFIGGEHVVLGGTEGDDWLIGDEGDDTLWGDGGDDRLEGGIGNDFIFGGDGDDIITDQFGDDEIRSGAGNDVVSAGQGINLIITDTGNDFVWAGDDLDEILLGQGDDFGAGGADEDMIIGGVGNDWLESGLDNGLLLGDNGDLVQGLPIKRSVDSPVVGHDVLVATGGNADFDAEQGDDIMVGGYGTDRFFGQFGFDWATYKNDAYGLEADMNLRLFAPPSLPASPGAILDRYSQTEALSGSRMADILRGDDEEDLGAGGAAAANNEAPLDHALKDYNVSLFRGLHEWLGPIDESGENRFSGGNILLGGSGSDIIEGRGGNDLIDGNKWLNVRIEVVALDGDGNPTDTVIESVDGMAALQERMFSGELKVSQLRIVREIVESRQGPNGETIVDGPSNQGDIDNVDIAQFSAVRADYVIEGYNEATGVATDQDGDGFISVTHLSRDNDGTIVAGEIGIDGIDRLKNIERLMFSDGTIKITNHANSIATGAPTITVAGPPGTPMEVGATLLASSAGITDADGISSAIVFYWQVELEPGSGVFENIQHVVADEFAPVTGPQFTLTDAEAGLRIRVVARFKDNDGVQETVVSAPTGAVGGDPIPEEGIVGTAGDDVLVGTPADDDIFGLGGNDILIGLEGSDVLDGGTGTDTAIIIGNVGEFTFERTPEGTIEIIHNVTGEEDELIGIETVIFASPGSVNLTTGIVTNPLAVFTIEQVALFADGLAQPPNNVATGGDDILVDVPGNAFVIDGLGGNDEIFGLDGQDTLNGGAGDDFLSGGNGADTLNGGPGNDIIDGGNGNDTAIFVGPLANFTFEISERGNVLVIDSITGDEDEVINVETLQFTGQSISIAQAEALAGLVEGTADPDVINGDANDNAIRGLGGADTITGAGGDDVLLGNGGADTLNGGAGRDALTGGGGNDTINGGADDDIIFWNAGDGRDTINGGAGDDTLEINGLADTAETFRIYTAAEAVAIGLNAGGAEIVVTRTIGSGTPTNDDRIALVNNIEEIVINGRPVRENGIELGDTIEVIGDFTTTSLALNTITVDGTRGNDVIDISGLASAHRILFKSNGGNDVLLGTLRPQDVIQLAKGHKLEDYTSTTNTDGTTTLSNGRHSITFTSTGTPNIQETPDSSSGGGGGSSDFTLTASDLAGLKALVTGNAPDDDDDMVTGVRTLSGEGNNPDNPDYGAADTPFIRLTQAHYGAADPAFGNYAVNPMFDGLDPRAISNILGDQEANLPKNAAGANIFFMAFGQYFDHGLDFIPKNGLVNGTIPIGGGSDDPADLARGEVHDVVHGVPRHLNKTSAYVDQNQAYGSNALVGQFLREGDGNGGLGSRLLQGVTDPSSPAHKLLPTLRELITHHWENNTIFHDGSLQGGQVAFRDYFAGFVNEEGDIVATAAQIKAMADNFMGSGHALLLDTNPFINLLDHFVAGDGRANENVSLTAIHTIWARNHNFHVENLMEAGFQGSAEEIFQAAKILNEAEYQRVVFDEFADALLGGIKGSGTHGHDDYNPDATASISHEFAAAAYRFGHSLISDTLTVIGPDGQPRQVALVDAFLNPTDDAFTAPLPPGYVPQDGFKQLGADAIIAGTMTQAAEEVDFNIVDAVRNDLVRIRADLFAFNVARGRDVGLGTLNQVRADLKASTDPYIAEARSYAGNLDPYESWEDFQARNGLSDAVIAQFKQAYPDLVLATEAEIAAFVAANPGIALLDGPNGSKRVKGIDRVDLWVGGLAERHINGGMVGQTFWIVLHEQFDRLQEADRFYYTDRLDNFDLYENIIDGQNFADIIKRNTNLVDLPERVFEVDDEDDDDTSGDDDTDDDSDDDDDTTGTGDDDDDDDDDDDTSGDDDDDDNDDDNDDDDSDDDNDDTSGGDDSDDDDDNAPGPGAGGSTLPFVVYLGTSGNDTHAGSVNNDTLAGGAGDDTLFGLAGDDNIAGGDGNDTLIGDAGNDILIGNAGADIIFAGTGNDTILAGAGDDTVYGDAGDDLIFGHEGRDVINAGDGNDTIFASIGDGDDAIHGGAGTDTLNLEALTQGVTVDLVSGQAFGAQSGNDTLSGIENVIGGGGNDTIVAGIGVNVLDGGGGNDTFVFTSVAAADGDQIVGFQQGDKIDLRPLFQSLNLPTGDDFSFTSATFNQAGQVRLNVVDGDTIIEGNTDAQADIDFAIKIAGRVVTSTDFIT